MARRLGAVACLCLGLSVVPAAHSALGGHVLGPQRILVVLLTWGPQPFTREEVQQAVFQELDARYRSMSYGKVSLTGDVTPWLQAFPGPAGCNLPPVRAAGTAAARAAGFDPAKYDRIVYVHPNAGCPWSGVTQAADVFMNGTIAPRFVTHELGHSFGLGHANLTDCKRHGCGALEYGDPYDTMGSGFGDFSAQGKYELGWLTRLSRVRRTGTYTLAAMERPSQRPQALVVTTANDQYWIELRSAAARDDDGRQTAGRGVILRVSASPDRDDFASSGIPNLLLANPAGRHRPELTRGERFVDTGVFTLGVQASTGSEARLRFRWTDATAPRAPRFTAALVGGHLQVSVDGARESGSGVARFDVTVDRQAPLSVGGDAAETPVQAGRPLPGSHVVKVVAVDRAGNRSVPAVRRIRVP